MSTTSAMDQLTYPPVIILLLASQIVIFDDHRHAWCHIQQDRTLKRLVLDRMIDRQE